jgi:predicted DNA-binding transcriptional regulator AlpA
MEVETPLDRASAVTQFWNAPDEALFPQPVLTAITGLSAAFFERGRWAGFGPRFLKLGRSVRYKKRDVLAWIEKRPAVSSTTEAAEKIGPQFGAPRRAKPKAKSTRRVPRQEQAEG